MTIDPLTQDVRHIQVNGRFRVVFERAASANKTDGFKVEANADLIATATEDAARLYAWALTLVETNKPVPPIVK